MDIIHELTFPRMCMLHIKLSKEAEELLDKETPKELNNVETHITGSVRELCRAAASNSGKLGYKPIILTDELCCEAREAGSFLASIAKTKAKDNESPKDRQHIME